MSEYNPQKIEAKWQKKWERSWTYEAADFDKKPKKYILVEFPYPSGDGLHVGHCRSYTALDIIARKSRMEGYNVIYPMGWDAFGLPAENYAIKTGRQPADVTRENTDTFRRQMKALGLSFDWSREVNTTDPEYYKWTQWIFLQFYKAGLAYKTKMPINWCPKDKIGLANEEVIDGRCERCGTEVVKKEMEQWMLRITAYADKLIEGLEEVDFPERVKNQQINWIGRSEGAIVKFPISNFQFPIEIFTTRLDTVFGVSAVVLSPEHPLITNYPPLKPPKNHSVLWHQKTRRAGELRITNKKEVEKYIKASKNKSDVERTDQKEKTGVELKGVKAVNPFNGEEVPVWIGDYVLAGYGTGAVMMVPAHDERDFVFAKKYNLPVKPVVIPKNQEIIATKSASKEKYKDLAISLASDSIIRQGPFLSDGILVKSQEFTEMESADARKKMTAWLEKKKFGKRKINYHLRDWVFSRQHYWGEPIPLVFCENCKKQAKISNFQFPISNKNQKSKIQNLKLSEGELLNPGWVSVPENELPLKLPKVKQYEPTDTGESPLSAIKSWVNTKCPKCGGRALRETDTMPNWAGSSWYFLRYADPRNKKTFADKKLMKYWLPVDVYNGGMEHTTLHLLYSRFWNRFLYDQGLVPFAEPYKKRTSHGMVLGEGGIKMSKSRGNVINPDKVVEEHGADTLRVYEMFMGPFGEAIPWDTKGVIGAKRFLEKVWNLQNKLLITNYELRIKELENLIHKTIKGVTEDINNFKFNTAISKLMILANEMSKEKVLLITHYSLLITLLSPFAPHLTEELWSRYSPSGVEGHSIFEQKWPKFDPKLAKDEEIEMIIQVNGKVRDRILVAVGISEDEAKKVALGSDKIITWIEGKEIRKIIFTGKLVNIVV